MILKIAAHPKLPDFYWYNQDAKDKYHSLAVQFPTLDVSTFINIFSSYLDTRPSEEIFRYKARLYFSQSDNLFLNLESVQEWKKNFVDLDLIEVPKTGHFVHFESNNIAQTIFGK